MIEVSAPEIPEQPLSFTAVTRHRDMTAPEAEPLALAGRVLLGGPVAFPMTAKRYPDMARYLEADAPHHRYYEVHLSLSFADVGQAPPLRSVSLAMRLCPVGAAELPIAWSMAPTRIEGPADRDVKFEIRPQIKVAGVAVSMGRVSGVATRAREPFLLALGELSSSPSWELRRTALPLDGRQRMILIVRAAKGVDTEIDIEVTASIKSAVLRRFRALPGPLKISARL
jgi:hypothetical protein